MTTTYEEIVVRDERLTVSKLAWRRHRRHVPGTAEAIYADNRGIADQGPFIPVGMTVRLAVQPSTESGTVTPAPRIELW